MTGLKLLVLDAAYTLDGVRKRGIEHSILVRDLGGFFDHVWSVQPLVGADPSEGHSIGGIAVEELAPRHTFVEAHVGRFPRLRSVPALNLALAQLGLWAHLLRMIRRERVSVVRVGDPYYLGIFGWLLSRLTRLPLVIRVNGNYDAIFAATGSLAYPRLLRSHRVEKILDRFVLARADMVLAPNLDNLAYALNNGARRECSHVIGFAGLVDPVHRVDPDERGGVRDELGLGSSPFVVCVSRLEAVKYPQDVIDAWHIARDVFHDLHLVMIGEGSMEDSLIARAASLGPIDTVHLVGSRSQDWIARALADAAVVAAPMAGRALVEAALSATPIVAYEVEWHAELIDQGTTGVLVPFRDAKAMGQALISMLNDPERARAIGSAAREKVVVQMDPDEITRSERSLYEDLLANASDATRRRS